VHHKLSAVWAELSIMAAQHNNGHQYSGMVLTPSFWQISWRSEKQRQRTSPLEPFPAQWHCETQLHCVTSGNVFGDTIYVSRKGWARRGCMQLLVVHQWSLPS